MANWVRSYLEANPNLAAMPVVQRAQHSLHLRRPDGKIEAHHTQVPCHYQDGNGVWQELDTALVDGGTFWYAPGTRPRIAKSNRRVSLINGTYSQTTSRIGLLNPTTGGFRSLWTIPAGSVSGDSVVSGTQNQYEHRITVTEDGLRETLTLLSNPGGMGAQPGEWLVIETLVEGITFPDGWVEEYSASGEHFPLPTATDANGDAPTCRRYAKQVSGTQYLYTGVLAAWFGSAAYPVVVDPDITAVMSSIIQGVNADYATARSTSTSGSTADLLVGQDTAYTVRRGLLKFDTSGIPSYYTIGQVNLKLVVTTDYSTTDFDVQVVKADWSSAEPLTSGTREAAYDIVGAAAVDALWRNTSGMAVDTPYTSANLDTTWVNLSGYTYYGLRSKNDTDATPPTASEYVTFYRVMDAAEYRPVLVITYVDTASGTALFPNTMATSAATAPYDDDDWTTPDNAKANDGSYAYVDSSTATSAGPRYPNGTLTTVNTTAPYDDLDWDDKAGVGADDTDYASITNGSFDSNVITYLGKAQQFGFTIPARAVITGIEVVVAKSRSAGTSCVDACIQLIDGSGVLFGNNKADGTTNWPSSITAITYGGAGDMWGLNTSTLTPAIVNDADFGVGIAVKATANNVDANVDYITVKVYYNDPTFDTNDYSYLLKASNFAFVIPTEATVTGVKVTVERKAAGTIKDAIVKLLDGSGALQGNDKADTATAWPTSDTAKDYGGDSDTWGATVTPAVINDTDFGVAIAVKADAVDSAAYIDYVSMTVYYSTGPGAYEGDVTLTRYHAATDAGGAGGFGAVATNRVMAAAEVGSLAIERSLTLDRLHGAAGVGLSGAFGPATINRIMTAAGSGLSGAFGSFTINRVLAVTEAGLAGTFGAVTLSKDGAITVAGVLAVETALTLARTLAVSETGLAGAFGVSSLGRTLAVTEVGLAGVLGSTAVNRVLVLSGGGLGRGFGSVTLSKLDGIAVTGVLAVESTVTLSRVLAAVSAGGAVGLSAISLGRAVAITRVGLAGAFSTTSLGRVLTASDSGLAGTLAATVLARYEATTQVGNLAVLVALTLDRHHAAAAARTVGVLAVINLARAHAVMELGLAGGFGTATLARLLDFDTTYGQSLSLSLALGRVLAVSDSGLAASTGTASLGRVLALTGVGGLSLSASLALARFLAVSGSGITGTSGAVTLSRVVAVTDVGLAGILGATSLACELGVTGAGSAGALAQAGMARLVGIDAVGAGQAYSLVMLLLALALATDGESSRGGVIVIYRRRVPEAVRVGSRGVSE